MFLLVATTCPIFSAHALTVTSTPISAEDLISRYEKVGNEGKPIRILVVPGHEPSSGGAEFLGLKERNMTVYTAEALVSYLKMDKKIEPILARDYTSWNETLSVYFANNWEAIKTFRREHLASMKTAIATGAVVKNQGVYHNLAPEETSVHLFGINKWANENNIDLVIHIHFNDDPDHKAKIEGDNQGIVVYIPDGQYGNATTSRAVALPVFAILNKYHATSTLKKEDLGITPDQDLIALGSQNTLLAPSILIEYGYIYEPQFWYAPIRRVANTDSAYETYLGIENFFNSTNLSSKTKASLQFPKKWLSIPASGKHDVSVYLLQKALAFLGYYPPKNKDLYECPMTGKVGNCTKQAIVEFQKVYGIKEIGFGVKTRAELAKILK